MIRLTKQTDYGIVLMTHLALAPDQVYKAPELAAETHFPLPMVSKVLKLLVRGGLLASQRGVKGGYALARPSAEISVAEIITALEGPIALTECVETVPEECSYESSCSLRGNWQLINTAVREALEKINLEEMARNLRPPVVPPPFEDQKLVPLGGVTS